MKSTQGWGNGNGNNETGFWGLPGGARDSEGRFSYGGEAGNWWSSSGKYWLKLVNRDWYAHTQIIPQNLGMGATIALIGYGYSVRCLSGDLPKLNVGTNGWLGKNLNVDRFANGDSIPEAKTAEEWKRAGENKQPAWCDYNNDPANGRTYGRLYNWYAVNDQRGLAPKGWHVPSHAEWTAITSYLGGETAGDALKSTYNGNSNSNSLPGYRNWDGSFTNLGMYGNWWSSSERRTTAEGFAYSRLLYVDRGGVGVGSAGKSSGYSVRCLRD